MDVAASFTSSCRLLEGWVLRIFLLTTLPAEDWVFESADSLRRLFEGLFLKSRQGLAGTPDP